MRGQGYIVLYIQRVCKINIFDPVYYRFKDVELQISNQFRIACFTENPVYQVLIEWLGNRQTFRIYLTNQNT